MREVCAADLSREDPSTGAGWSAQGASIPRSSGSSLSTTLSSRIAETPSISAWWILW